MRHIKCLHIVYMLFTCLLTGNAAAADLTPSVRYFSFDYNADTMSNTLDSIIAGRYDALVAGGGFDGSGYGNKYSDLAAHKADLWFFGYTDLHDAFYSNGGVNQVNQEIGPYMADSTTLYWHSMDSVEVSWGWVEPFASGEANSRLKSYGGGRALVNLTASDFALNYADHYWDTLQNLTVGWTLRGPWGDNMSFAQGADVSTCPSGRGRLQEDNLGNDVLWGCINSIYDWHENYLDTQLIDGIAAAGDSLESRLGLHLCVNAVSWGTYYQNTSVYEFQDEYYDTSRVGHVWRTFEWGSRSVHAGEFFFHGPTNAASQIDSTTVCTWYSPMSMYAAQVGLAIHNVGWWFNPRTALSNRHYGFSKTWYDDLCLYYIHRSQTTFLNFANEPCDGANEHNWYNGATAESCVHAGLEGDSCYWIGALGVRLGRDDDVTGWNTDTVRWYLGSVQCLPCMDTVGIGKDDVNQNFVIFLRRWSGDDSYNYMVLQRTAGDDQTTFTNSWSSTFSLPTGNWNKLTVAGSWGSAITQDSLRNGEGGIYRQVSSGPKRLRGVK